MTTATAQEKGRLGMAAGNEDEGVTQRQNRNRSRPDSSPSFSATLASNPAPTWSGNFIVQRAIFLVRPFGRDKRANLVSLNLGFHMGRKHEADLGLPAIMEETGLGRQAVIDALEIACGPKGLFERVRRGPGRCNRYTLKPGILADPVMSGNSDTMKSGKSDIR